MGRLVGLMEGGYCCKARPGAEENSAGGGMTEDMDESSDQDLATHSSDGVGVESLRHCVGATCRALAALPLGHEGRQ